MDALDSFSNAELLDALSTVTAENELFAWFDPEYPYWWQKQFFDAGSFAKQRLVIAANGCVSPWTIIETVPQSRRIVDILGETSFDVRSWAGESECVAQGHGVFLKSIEPAFRFHLDNGEFFDCTDKHRVLTDDGWLAAGQLVRASSGLRWKQTIQDFQANCGVDVHSCDGQPRLASGSDVVSLPLKADAQKSFLFYFGPMDAEVRIPRYSHAYQALAQTSIDETARQIADLCERFEDPFACIAFLHSSDVHQACRQSVAELSHYESTQQLQNHPTSLASSLAERGVFCAAEETPEGKQRLRLSPTQYFEWCDVGQASLGLEQRESHTEIFYPSTHPVLKGDRRIISVVPLGYQPILDFTVEKTACYWSGGAIHHNTGKSQTVCAELAMHVTGRYPPWWKGVRFDYGGWECWIGSIDNDMQKRGPQRALLGRELDQLGTGLIPKDAIAKDPQLRQAGVKGVVDTLVINHASGKPVTMKFLTFEQGWRKWQSGDPKIILWDEEPDDSNVDQKDILSEVLTRLVRNNGIFIVGYTPLLGETELTRHFMHSEDDQVWHISATWDDAPHMDDAAKEMIKKQYPEHQREARTKGIPMLGEGRIFRVAESDLLVDPYEIPDHWARICGIDLGLAHPAACSWLAWDRDSGKTVLYDCWRKKGALTKEHAGVINGRGRWIPVAWPHDGEKRDPKSGARFHDIYRDEYKVNMLSKSARYKRGVGGAQAQWPVIEDIRNDMEASQFEVFRTCKYWIDEYRSYHVKDGKIVSLRDDTLKASFYAKMMQRYSVSKREGDRMISTVRQIPAPITTSVRR